MRSTSPDAREDHGEWELTTKPSGSCSSTMLLSGMRGLARCSLLGAMAGQQGKDHSKKELFHVRGGPCKIASTPCFAPVISLFWHSEKIVQMSLSYRKSRNNLSHLAGTGPVTWQSSLYFSLLAGKPPTETGSPMTASTVPRSCSARLYWRFAVSPHVLPHGRFCGPQRPAHGKSGFY